MLLLLLVFLSSKSDIRLQFLLAMVINKAVCWRHRLCRLLQWVHLSNFVLSSEGPITKAMRSEAVPLAARTLGSRVWIPLEKWMCLLFLLYCAVIRRWKYCNGPAPFPPPVQEDLPNIGKRAQKIPQKGDGSECGIALHGSNMNSGGKITGKETSLHQLSS